MAGQGRTGAKITIINYLNENIGKTFTSDEVQANSKTSASYGYAGMILKELYLSNLITRKKDTRPIEYTITQEIVIERKTPGRKKGNSYQNSNIKKQLTLNTTPPRVEKIPRIDPNTKRLVDLKNTPSLDISGIMQHVVMVDEQNKMLRNALENIALILDQAGILDGQ